jgi:hypothetical protein
MFKGEGGWVGIIGTILFVAITNSSFTGGANVIKALQGR